MKSIIIILSLLILSCDYGHKKIGQNTVIPHKQEKEKLGTNTEEIKNNILLVNNTQRTFSNPNTKDIFSIKITGPSLLKGQMIFQITDSNGNVILKEEYPSNYLIGYEFDDDDPIEKKEEHIKKRVAEFFKDDNFFTPAIEKDLKYDEDYSDLKVWNDIKSDSTAIGFYYLIGAENGSKIAYSKKEKKVVMYFNCC